MFEEDVGLESGSMVAIAFGKSYGIGSPKDDGGEHVGKHRAGKLEIGKKV